MSIYALKGRFQDLLRPLVRGLQRIGVTANQVTLAAAVLSLVVAFAVWRYAPAQPLLYALLPAWMFARMGLNAVDGMLAREFGQASRLGAYLNELCDVLADAALYLALLSLPGLPAASAWLFALAAAFTEYAGVLGVMTGASRRYDGPMGKSDRAFVIGVLGVLLAGGWIDGGMVAWVLWTASALCAVTVIRRVRSGLQQGEHK